MLITSRSHRIRQKLTALVFVGSVETVNWAVTPFVVVDTFSTSLTTNELQQFRIFASSLDRITSSNVINLLICSGTTFITIHFVRIVRTILNAVAAIARIDATFVITFKLIRPTSNVYKVRCKFFFVRLGKENLIKVLCRGGSWICIWNLSRNILTLDAKFCEK